MHMASYAVYSSSDNMVSKTTSGFIKGTYEKYKTKWQNYCDIQAKWHPSAETNRMWAPSC